VAPRFFHLFFGIVWNWADCRGVALGWEGVGLLYLWRHWARSRSSSRSRTDRRRVGLASKNIETLQLWRMRDTDFTRP